MNKSIYIIGILLIAGFAVLGAMELMNAQTPYVSTVAEVKSAINRPVQFMGSIIREKSHYNESNDELQFALKDKDGAILNVRYKGVKPANFDDANQAVVRGMYRGNELVADQLLLKCPSKYQGK